MLGALMAKDTVLTFILVRSTIQPFSKTQCLDLLIKKLESFCNSISRAHDLVAYRMTVHPHPRHFWQICNELQKSVHTIF